MAAYAATNSLKRTIQQLYRDRPLPFSDTTIMSLALDGVESLQEVLKQVDDSSGSERVDAFEDQIREAAYELEDSLESQLLSQSEESPGERSQPLWLDLQEVKQYVDSFTQKVVKIKEEYIDESTNQYDFGASSSIAGFGEKKAKMVGLSVELENTKEWLLAANCPVSIVGMAGTGKTTLAREIFEDPSILHHFDRRAWVTIGPKYNLDEIRHCIVAQVNPENYKKLVEEGNELSVHPLSTSSGSCRYLIVLDDVWDFDMYDKLFGHFPSNHNDTRVLVTTRMVDIEEEAPNFGVVQKTRLMNEEESWDLLREKVFGSKEYSCPPQLEKAGKEIIAKNCEGYPPAIIKLAQLLSKSERTAECWSKAPETRNSVFMEANNEGLNLVSSTIDFDGKKPATVGLSDDLTKIKDWLKDSSYALEAISLVGMAGIGKTTLAKEVFEDPLILSNFDIRVWITVDPKYRLKEILQGIVGQVNPGVDIDIDMLDWHLYNSLKDRRYLIVLDDVWDTHILNYLKTCCPDLGIGSKLLVTTELRDVLPDYRYERFAYRSRVHEMHLLNNEESWCLLRQKVFGEESCPFGLEKAGKKIAEKCEGLPLAIVTVANLLSKENKTPDRWNEIAEAEENSVFYDAYEQMSDKLIPSYNYLPRHLKAIFLYMGVFSKNYVIPRSKLIRIWNAEGFMEQNAQETVEYFAEKCLQELIARNLVIVCQQTSSGAPKTCKLHSVFWHLCNRTAQKKKLFHALSRHADGFAEDIKSERRLSVRNSVLFHIEDVYNSMASISTLRSLLCTGPHYHYSIQICLAWRLLRVLDAHTIRFYQFPIEATKLVRLRYFAITYNGKLPPSISKLRNLQYLIVHRHLDIKFCEDSSYLPVEIWEMRALKHLQVAGSNLPDPPIGAFLEDLLTLLDVGVRSCTERVIECIPNLVKLRIQIELAPDAPVVPSYYFNVYFLGKLKSLKCVIMNPEVNVDIPQPFSLPMGSYGNLTKLTLCGCEYPREYMSFIGSLRELKVLKLQSYAFCELLWETFEWRLWCLKILVLEDLDLVHLNGISLRFPGIERLIIRHCYKLKEIPSGIVYTSLKLIELVDCSPLAVDSVEDIRKQRKKQNQDYPHSSPELEVRIYSSWK